MAIVVIASDAPAADAGRTRIPAIADSLLDVFVLIDSIVEPALMRHDADAGRDEDEERATEVGEGFEHSGFAFAGGGKRLASQASSPASPR